MTTTTNERHTIMVLIKHMAAEEMTFIPTAFIRSSLSHEAKLAYLSTASRRQSGEGDPTDEVIAAETGLTITQVESGIEELNSLPHAEWNRLGL